MQTSDLNVKNTESDHTNAIFRRFQDAIFSREHTYVKTLTKIIFDLLQWQEITTLSLPNKATIASFISTTFREHFCLGANDIARNRSRVIFSRACADIFRRWSYRVSFPKVSNNRIYFGVNQHTKITIFRNLSSMVLDDKRNARLPRGLLDS